MEHINSKLGAGGYPVTAFDYENSPPSAHAGDDQTVGQEAVVTLDGSGSSDPDDNISLYLWTQIGDGPRVSLSDPWAVQPTFAAPDVGTEDISMTFRLTVTDTEGLQSEDTVSVFMTGEEKNGYEVFSELWIRAVIHTVEKGPVEAVWKEGGQEMTAGGHQVIWGYFHASPEDVNWGSENNPDLFVKIWFDAGGRIDVNYFHVSVPKIDVYSDYLNDSMDASHNTATLEKRYIRQYYENGESLMEEGFEDGNPQEGDLSESEPLGDSLANDLRIGAVIHTVDGQIDAVWHKGGEDTTAGGHQVVWGHFYADPSHADWGSRENPDIFVKIWFDVSGRVDVNYFHVSVPDIEVCSDFDDDGFYDEKGTTVLKNRYVRHEFLR